MNFAPLQLDTRGGQARPSRVRMKRAGRGIPEVMEKEERLRRSHQFREVYSRGRRLKGPHLTILFISNRLPCTRLGLSVSKKRVKLSVRRHYIQRCLREIYRRNKRAFLPGYDIVIGVHRFDRNRTCFKDIKEELLSLAHKAKLLNQ